MSRGVKFKLDRAGVGQILRSAEVAQMANAAAEQLAAQVRSVTDEPVTVMPYRTDRQAAHVTIASRHGVRVQATDGALTRAAAALGLTVNPR